MPNFWRTDIHQWIFKNYFQYSLSMLILCQNSCFLGPTIFKFYNQTDIIMYKAW